MKLNGAFLRRSRRAIRSAAYPLKEKTMSASGSYQLPASHRDAQAEIERLAAQAHSGWDKEARSLSWFGLKDGMSVLELGCQGSPHREP